MELERLGARQVAVLCQAALRAYPRKDARGVRRPSEAVSAILRHERRILERAEAVCRARARELSRLERS